MQLIEASEKGKLTVKQICKRLKCEKSLVYNVLKQKNEIKEQWKNGKLYLSFKPINAPNSPETHQ